MRTHWNCQGGSGLKIVESEFPSGLTSSVQDRPLDLGAMPGRTTQGQREQLVDTWGLAKKWLRKSTVGVPLPQEGLGFPALAPPPPPNNASGGGIPRGWVFSTQFAARNLSSSGPAVLHFPSTLEFEVKR